MAEKFYWQGVGKQLLFIVTCSNHAAWLPSLLTESLRPFLRPFIFAMPEALRVLVDLAISPLTSYEMSLKRRGWHLYSLARVLEKILTME